MRIMVTFTETVTRTLPFDIKALDGMSTDEVDDLDESELHDLMGEENVWDQPAPLDWLGGDVEDRYVDEWVRGTEVAVEAEPARSGLGERTPEYDV